MWAKCLNVPFDTVRMWNMNLCSCGPSNSWQYGGWSWLSIWQSWIDGASTEELPSPNLHVCGTFSWLAQEGPAQWPVLTQGLGLIFIGKVADYIAWRKSSKQPSSMVSASDSHSDWLLLGKMSWNKPFPSHIEYLGLEPTIKSSGKFKLVDIIKVQVFIPLK